MDFLEFKTGHDDTGRRLDKVLRIFAPSLSLAQIYKSLRKGLIKVNQKKAQPDYKIQEGDIIYAADFLINNCNDEKKTIKKLPSAKTFDIPVVFCNEHLLILNKPAGINIHPAKKGEYSLTDFAMSIYQDSHKKDSLAFKPGPLHRLDKMTGGLVCFSMSYEGASWFCLNMKNHLIQKTYISVVQGIIDKPEHWEDLLSKAQDVDAKGIFHTVKLNSEDGKTAITKVFPVKSGLYKGQKLSVVEFKILTGRQHQIRAQAAGHGHALWGDTAYGGSKTSKNNGKYMLYAYKLEFPQNELGIPQAVQIKLPGDIKEVLDLL
ncbi:MAG: RluA family pseudouridine synthase [Treponema sp.]|nr:RluA family pseudouridine synthase [Treponema sp.]